METPVRRLHGSTTTERKRLGTFLRWKSEMDGLTIWKATLQLKRHEAVAGIGAGWLVGRLNQRTYVVGYRWQNTECPAGVREQGQVKDVKYLLTEFQRQGSKIHVMHEYW